MEANSRGRKRRAKEGPGTQTSKNVVTTAPSKGHHKTRRKGKYTKPLPYESESTWTFSLPEEIMLLVFSFLAPSDVCRCMFVCRCWGRLTRDETLWHTLYLRSWNEAVADDELRQAWLEFLSSPELPRSWRRRYMEVDCLVEYLTIRQLAGRLVRTDLPKSYVDGRRVAQALSICIARMDLFEQSEARRKPSSSSASPHSSGLLLQTWGIPYTSNEVVRKTLHDWQVRAKSVRSALNESTPAAEANRLLKLSDDPHFLTQEEAILLLLAILHGARTDRRDESLLMNCTCGKLAGDSWTLCSWVEQNLFGTRAHLRAILRQTTNHAKRQADSVLAWFPLNRTRYFTAKGDRYWGVALMSPQRFGLIWYNTN